MRLRAHIACKSIRVQKVFFKKNFDCAVIYSVCSCTDPYSFVSSGGCCSCGGGGAGCPSPSPSSGWCMYLSYSGLCFSSLMTTLGSNPFSGFIPVYGPLSTASGFTPAASPERAKVDIKLGACKALSAIITGRNEVVAKVMFLLVSVILYTGGGAIPACIAGGLQGVSAPGGVSAPPLGVCSREGGLLPGGVCSRGGCLLLGGVCSWGVSAPGGGVCGLLLWPSCLVAF